MLTTKLMVSFLILPLPSIQEEGTQLYSTHPRCTLQQQTRRGCKTRLFMRCSIAIISGICIEPVSRLLIYHICCTFTSLTMAPHTPSFCLCYDLPFSFTQVHELLELYFQQTSDNKFLVLLMVLLLSVGGDSSLLVLFQLPILVLKCKTLSQAFCATTATWRCEKVTLQKGDLLLWKYKSSYSEIT